jgi:hypothetical protein
MNMVIKKEINTQLKNITRDLWKKKQNLYIITIYDSFR